MKCGGRRHMCRPWGAHQWWELIPTAGLAASPTESEWRGAISALEEDVIFGPVSLGKAQLDQLQIISVGPTDMQLIRRLWRVCDAISHRRMYHARTVPAWHVSTRWAAFKLADAAAAYPTEASKIGEEAAGAAPQPGGFGPRCKNFGPSLETSGSIRKRSLCGGYVDVR